MKTLMSQSGFSIVQGMILAGVVAGSSLVATRLLTDQKLAQRNAETRDQVEQLHKLVYATLQDKDNCTQTFFSGSFPNMTLNYGAATPSSVRNKSGGAVVEKFNVSNKMYMNNNVSLNDMTLTYTPAPPGVAAPMGTLTLNYQRMTQDAAGTKRMKDGYGAKDVAKKLTIKIQRDPLYRVPGSNPPNYTYPYTSCYVVTDDSDTSNTNGEDGNQDLSKKMCEELNSGDGTSAGKSFFVWDPATSTCVPKENICKVAGEVNTGINSNGEVECRRIQDWMDTSKLIDQSSSLSCPPNKNVQIDTSSGKIKINCI